MSERRSPEWIRRLVVRGTTDVVGQCRDFTRRALTEWQWMPEAGSGKGGGTGGDDETADTVDDVLLLVSEVVANACLHAGGPSSLLLRCAAGRLRIEVTDASPVVPALRVPADPARPGGHGMLIVQRLARDWGSEPVDGGKCVWLEVAAPPALR